jgi:hypoxia up-regulated 1
MRLPRNLFLLLAWVLPAVSAAILAIDYGADFTKLSLVKPGVPFDILLDRDSKRKIPSVVSWKREDRVVGTEGKLAVSNPLTISSDPQATRFPNTHFPYIKAVLGQTEVPNLDIFPNPPVLTEGGSLVFSHDKIPKHITPKPDEKEAWTPTALLAHQIAYYKSLADAAAGESVTQAVVTVPASWNQAQRRAYRDALELQGIQCMAMMGEGTAIGLNYAMTRTFPDYNPETGEGEKEYHLVFDSGALSTSATVLGFYQTSWKPTPNSKMLINTTHVEALGVGWEDVGGISLDLALRDLLIDDFITKTGRKDIINDKKAIAKIDKEAIRVKQILSANQESMTSIESVFDDIDFRSKVSRMALEGKFEGKMADFMKPIKQALDAAGLELSNISSVILFGGNTRVPFIRAELHEVLGGDELIAQNVNADESAVLGAAFYGASLSRQFKMKSVQIHERSIYDIKMGDEVIFPAGTPLGERKSFLLKPEDEIDLTFSQNGTPISQLSISDIKDALANFTGSEPAVNITVRLDARGVLGVANAALVSGSKDEPASGGVAGALKGMFGGKKEEATDAEVEAEADTEQPEAETNATEKPAKKAVKPRVALKFREKPLAASHLTKEQKQQANQRLRAIASYEGAMRAREEARNMLEGYLYKLQNLLSGDEEEHKNLHAFSTKTERKRIKDLVDETLEWLHEHAEQATVHSLIGKREAIEALEQPIVTRFDEFEKRPAAVVNFRTALYAGRAFVDEARENVTAAAEEAKKAPVDQPVAPPRYTDAEIQGIEDMILEGGKWLDELMEKQMQLNEDPTSDPVIFVKDLDERGQKIQAAVLRLTSRRPPRAPKIKPVKPSASQEKPEEKEAKESKEAPKHEEL